MVVRIAAFVLFYCVALPAAEIRGTVKNAAGGEPLERVQVSVLEADRKTATAADGTFVVQNLAAGNYTLRLSAVGYRLSTLSFSLSAAESKEFDLTLVPDNFRHTETVRVTGDTFQQEDSPAVSENNLTASEIREASTVFADDPFRAIQALPGVSAPANNEFYAQFTVMGTPFKNVSIYLDDVLATPFHSIPDISNGASLSFLTSETVEEMKLMPLAYPVKFGDGIGAALDIRTREGSRSAPLFRVSAGIADSDILGEGELGHARHGSWIASGRKSYIGYLIRNRENNVQDVTFYDGDVRLDYDLTAKQSVNFHALGGQTYTALNRSSNPDAFATGNSAFTYARVGWRWSISPRLLLDSHAGYLSEPYDSHNSLGQSLDTYAYGEWLGGTKLTWAWKNDDVVEGGVSLRRLRDDGYTVFYESQGSGFFSTLRPPCGAVEPLTGTSIYQRDYSRGVQVVLQRRSANGLSGWVGYTLAHARQREYSVLLPLSQFAGEPFSFNTPYYSTLQDQRHSLNIFATYRLTPTINLSGKALYGSGYPVPSGNFEQVGNTYYEVGINTVRLPAYLRLDLRCDKSWAFKRWKLTLYGEVLNLTNHDNRIYTYSTGVNPNTLQSTIQTEQELPVTPTAGLVFEF